MTSKQLLQSPNTWVLILSTGDNLTDSIQQFALEHELSGSSFKAVGALSSAKFGWYNPKSKKYDTVVDLHEQVELLSLIGDIAIFEGRPALHAHVVVGLSDGTTRGGHLLEAVIHPTCEVFLEESPVHLRKEIDPESGLALIAI